MRLLVHDYAGHPFQVQLSRELARRGHTVRHAYAGELQTPRGDLLPRADDAPTFSLYEGAMDPRYARRKYSFVRRRGMEIAYGRRVAKMIREWEPQIVLSANTPTEAQSHLLRASRDGGARFALWLQDFYCLAVDKLVRKKLPVGFSKIGGAAIGAYYRQLDRRQFQASDAIVAITDDFVPLLVDQFGVQREKIHTIPNWAPLDAIPVEPSHNAWRLRQGLAGKFVFLYTGTLGMKHNPKLLLELAKQFQSDPSVRVVVVSEGIGATWLAEQVAASGLTNLQVLPYQPFGELPQVLATGDVLIGVLEEAAGVFSVPSKVLTYLCAERPLLLAAPAVNLASRLVRDHHAGLTVAPADVAGFLDAATRLHSDAELRESKGRNGRQYAQQTFDIGQIATRFETLLAG